MNTRLTFPRRLRASLRFNLLILGALLSLTACVTLEVGIEPAGTPAGAAAPTAVVTATENEGAPSLMMTPTPTPEDWVPPTPEPAFTPMPVDSYPVPDALRVAFRIEVKRKQRRSDGTVSLEGQRFELPSRYRHLSEVHLRYARWDLSRVDLVDARSGAILCPVRPLDKAANADAQRRPIEPTDTAPAATPVTGIAPLMKQLLADYAASGLPPAYLPLTPDTTEPKEPT